MSEKEDTPKWLTELQQKSWEPEILLSGIVLYGMFKLPEMLDSGLVYFSTNIYGQTTDIDNLVTVLKLATYWLIGGLVLHLVSRGIWIGMVGLSYTFPKGINQDSLHYKGNFNEKVRAIPSFQRIIINLEKICSSLFSISFMMFMVMVGAYLYLFITALIPFFIILYITNDWNHWAMQVFQYYTVVIIVFGFMGILDFITLGYFRRFRWVAFVYWPIHKMISIFTLSRYYRGIYYGLVSNLNKWYIFFGLLIFTTFNFAIFDMVNTTHYADISFSRIKLWHSINGYTAFHGYYDDQNSESFSVRASIPSDIIDENTLRLFIVANVYVEDSVMAYKYSVPGIDTLTGANRSLRIVEKFYHVYVDDSLVRDYPIRFHYKTQTRQMGYLVYLDITDMKAGLHEIKVGGPPEMYGSRTWAQIPFYRERRDFPLFGDNPSKTDEKDNQLRSVKPLIVN